MRESTLMSGGEAWTSRTLVRAESRPDVPGATESRSGTVRRDRLPSEQRDWVLIEAAKAAVDAHNRLGLLAPVGASPCHGSQSTLAAGPLRLEAGLRPEGAGVHWLHDGWLHDGGSCSGTRTGPPHAHATTSPRRTGGRQGPPTPSLGAPLSALRSRRVTVGLTLQQFAAAVYTSTATASRWETGKRRPHRDQLPRIADVLGVDLPWLLRAVSSAPERVADTVVCLGLRALREAVGMSRRSLAEQLSVSVATVAHWECGRRRLPRERFPSLSRALSVPRQELEPALARPVVEAPGSQLRELRVRAGVTQASAAKALGVTASTISGYERGIRNVPYRHVRRLAVVYEQSISTVANAAGQAPVAHPADLEFENSSPAAVIRAVRAWESVTRAELGRRAGIHPGTIRRWEEGTSTPTPRYLSVLESVLGLRTGSLQKPARTSVPGTADYSLA